MPAEDDEITVDQLLAEYERLGLDDPRGFTTEELGRRWGLGDDAVRRRLRQAAKAGILRAGKKRVPRLGGGTTQVPSYWVERAAARGRKK